MAASEAIDMQFPGMLKLRSVGLGGKGKDSSLIKSGSDREAAVIDLINRVCTSVNINKEVGFYRDSKRVAARADGWAEECKEILTTDKGEDMLEDPEIFKEVEDYFKEFERKEAKVDNLKEFEMIEAFVKEEKTSGRKKREEAQLLAASEEVRLAAEIAEIKGYREKEQTLVSNQKLPQKVADTEKSFAARKMAIGKAARLATSDVRKQFKRVRDFFESLHEARVQKLERQYSRSLKIQSVLHRLRNADPRVMALEQNTAERIFRKKETDMQELNMVQNLEEATYLEKIIALLDKVQGSKEAAADAYFQLQMKHLKYMHHADQARADEMTELRSKGILDMAEMIAKYVKEEFQDREEEEKTKELVESTERKKDILNSNSKVLLSVSDLYDTILWSVATGSIGLTTSETDTFESYEYDDYDDDDEGDGKEQENNDINSPSKEQSDNKVNWRGDTSDTGSVQSGSTANTSSTSNESLSPVGHIFVKKLRRDIHAKEKELEKKHKAERKREKRAFRAECRQLKQKHRAIVDNMLAECVHERHKLREAISQRMVAVERNQKESSLTLQEAIEADVSAMQQAWTEHRRLEDEQKTNFAKAQALISAQVFHEVRNALSSVVAMSEMTSSLQRDPTVVPETLISSVSEMLDQNKEVVNYSLSMLNNILDVSKIKAGSFETKRSFFDLQDLVSRSTTMQLVKAKTKGVKMSFEPMPEPQITYTDEDIVVRIITNFISNAVKFTKAGAVQPFVCPLESLQPSKAGKVLKLTQDEKNKKMIVNKTEQFAELEKLRDDDGMKMVAVGVADTGPGLSRELLNIAEAGLFNSDASKMNSGAKNSGFGLHLAHQLAGTLGSTVNLTELDSFQHLYNSDMATVINVSDDENSPSEAGSVCSDNTPGKGSVLYITVPVLQNGRKGLELLNSTLSSQQVLDMSSKKYTFYPRPAPNSIDGCFRILVADDVSMLRKGLVRSVVDIFSEFSDCPVSVSTACTAEDALRAIANQSYDMFICDNQFATPTDVKRMSQAEIGDEETPRLEVRSDGDKNLVRKAVTEFFNNESFTIEHGDGSLSGTDALLQLAQTKNNNSYPTPILVLHTGHELELPKELGVIVVRKPLRRADFIPLLERNAHNLIETGMCLENKRDNKIFISNKGGAQFFRRRQRQSAGLQFHTTASMRGTGYLSCYISTFESEAKLSNKIFHTWH